jgi:hypothetical protein
MNSQLSPPSPQGRISLPGAGALQSRKKKQLGTYEQLYENLQNTIKEQNGKLKILKES